MKKLLVLIAGAIGATLLKKKLDEQQAERALWSEATDSSSTQAGPGGAATPPAVG